MQILEGMNVNHLMIAGIRQVVRDGDRMESRNGAVLACPYPVVSVFHNPDQRVLFSPARDANPFFHLFEAMWMMAGREDVDFVAQFVSRMREYSDDGLILNGAYGYRWRNYWPKDQLAEVIKILKEDPTSRRAVLTMWDGEDLFNQTSKDIPCNTHIYFRAHLGKLSMTVCNRSNDIIWGLYGANTVHLSILHEFIASALGLELGFYRHLSNNFHLYPQAIPYRDILADGVHDYYNPHRDDFVLPTSLGVTPDNWEEWLREAEAFCAGEMADLPFFAETVWPMYEMWGSRNTDVWLAYSPTSDWGRAGREWLLRKRRADNG